MQITLAKLVSLLVAVALLTGCSSANPQAVEGSGPEPTASSASDARSVADSLWRSLAARYPGAERPSVDLVRYVTPREWATAQSDCLHEAGFPDVSVMDDGGLQVLGVPDSQKEALAVAQYVCGVKYAIDPQYTDPFTEDELNSIYVYYVDFLVPCLTGQGYSVADVPSRGSFVDSRGRWSPYESVEPGTQESWVALNKTCPQWPDGLFG